MAQDQMLRDSLPFARKRNAPVASYVKVARAGHAFERGGNGWRRDAKILSQPRADRDLFFLHNFPDGFEVVFLGDAGLFAAQNASQITESLWRQPPGTGASAGPIPSRAPGYHRRCGDAFPPLRRKDRPLSNPRRRDQQIETSPEVLTY